MLKMILTGMLIYVPSISRAGIAILVCLIAVANLNYFTPHKNIVLFWLTQISFITTTSKYVVALLLSAKIEESQLEQENAIMGVLLITLDIFFMASSLIAILISAWVLRKKIQEIQNESKKAVNRNQSEINNDTRIVPIVNGDGVVEESDNDDEIRFNSASNTIQRPLRTTSILRKSRTIQDAFRKSEIALNVEQKKKQEKQHRSTQLRLMARLKIRKTKALTRVPLFQNIPPEGIDSILELTTYQKASMNEVLCSEGDTATKFYIIVSGRCSVVVKSKGEDQHLLQRKVGTLKELDYFGESALCGGEQDAIRNATVTVESQFVQVLMLSRTHFDTLIEQGVVTNKMVSAVVEERKRRSEMTRETSMLSKDEC